MKGMETAKEFMLALLEELSGYSMSGPGVTRLLYGNEWIQAQSFLAARMETLGFEVYSDVVGNVYGRVAGTDPDAPAVLTGSHIDTVRAGGKYDGAYGIAAGVAAVDFLLRSYGRPRRTLEVVSFCEEEGSRFPLSFWGSGSVSGAFALSEASKHVDLSGISLLEAMKAAGYGREDQPEAFRRDLAAFVEVHIEQGVTLERMNLEIGVVTAIVGQKRYTVTVYGEVNHAGTTPMTMRRDPLACAAEMIYELEKLAAAEGDPLVATVGRMEVAPNTPNVIPGKVTFTVDVRHSDEQALSMFCLTFLRVFESIATGRGNGFEHSVWGDTSPAGMHPALCASLGRICGELGLSYRMMASGAGHDAQMLQKICPAAMIFVPSVNGISHSPDEYSPPKALGDGLAALIRLLYDLAYEERLP